MNDGDIVFLRCFLMIAIPAGVLVAMMMGFWIFCIIMQIKSEKERDEYDREFMNHLQRGRDQILENMKAINGMRND